MISKQEQYGILVLMEMSATVVNLPKRIWKKLHEYVIFEKLVQILKTHSQKKNPLKMQNALLLKLFHCKQRRM